jgi:ribosomal protein S18 acetylase RimI-like enzyme
MDRKTVIEAFHYYSIWLRLLDDMEEHTWTMPIGPDKWSCREIISHITNWDKHLLTKVLPSIEQGEGMFFPDFDPFNEAAAEYARSGISKIELLHEAKETRNQLIKALKEMPAEQLCHSVPSNGETHCPHTGTPYSLLYIIQEFTYHDRHHQKQIADIGGLPPIYVRRAEEENIEGISHLFDLYRMFYKQPSNLTGAKAFLKDRLDKDESAIFFAADLQGYIGFVQLYPSFSSISMQRTWILNDLYTLPEERNRGAGALLLDQAKRFAMKTGAKEISLSTAIDNAPAKRLYRKHGYTEDTFFSHYELSLNPR